MLTLRPYTSRNLADLQRIIGPNDYIISRLARTETSSTVQFMAWPTATATDIYQYASSLPVKSRALHSIFGRPGVPMDFCADLDMEVDPTIKENQRNGFALVERVCDEATKMLDKAFGKKFEKVIALQSFSKKKLSYHIHARVDDKTAFTDFRDVGHFTTLIQNELGKDKLAEILDTHIFRPNGSLRAYDCVKSMGDEITLSHVALKRPNKWEPLPEELFDLSLSMRPLIDITTKLHFEGETKPARVNQPGSSAEKSQECLAYVAANVPKLDATHATDYKTWLNVGLTLKACEHYINMHPETVTGHNYQELFHSFSGLSQKYSYANIERWWKKFKIPGNIELERSAGYIRKLLRTKK